MRACTYNCFKEVCVDCERHIADTIREKDRRIAELEAEVERLKAFCNEWVHNEEAFQKESAVEICPIITQEGEG